MSKQRWIVAGMLGLLGWAWLGADVTQAQVTLSIYQVPAPGSTPQEVLNWLPEPGQDVLLGVKVNGIPVPSPSVNLASTTNHPGQCTNFDNPSGMDRLAPDFESPVNAGIFDVEQDAGVTNVTLFRLRPTDCGGTANIAVTANGFSATIRIPPDNDNAGNGDGIPDSWEQTFCSGNCDPVEDAETAPLPASQVGDGYSAFDEYRGFMVSDVAFDTSLGFSIPGSAAEMAPRRHIRTHPRSVRDLFVHVVHAQCAAAGANSLLQVLDAPAPANEDPKEALDDPAALFANFGNFGARIHLLDYKAGAPPSTTTTSDEWVDRFVSLVVRDIDLSATTRLERVFTFRDDSNMEFQFPANIGATPTSPPALDRVVAFNAVHPPGPAPGLRQKGLRLTECLDASVTSPLGQSGHGTPGGLIDAVVYTQRIENYVDTLTVNSRGQPININLGTFDFFGTHVAATVLVPGCIIHANGVCQNTSPALVKKALKQFYVAHELGHATRLTQNFSSLYDYHWAPGYGSTQDQSAEVKTSGSPSGTKIWIPTLFRETDQQQFALK